ncbi:MAG: hypothetical protein WB284_10050 [Methanoregula sp.]
MADSSSQPWSWSNYSGTTMWQVTVTEDQSACSGPVLTNQYSVPIQFSAGSAVMGDVGHGSAGGTFISGNILHIPSRSVADPPGSSDLSAYDVYFTTDCSAFAAKYSWDYTGPDGDCSGTTALAGANSNGCPGSGATTTNSAATPTSAEAGVPVIPSVAPASSTYLSSDIAAARYDFNNDLAVRLDRDTITHQVQAGQISPADANARISQDTAQINAMEQKIEGEYKAILSKDSTNFDANADLAELKKTQGKWDEFTLYMNAALANTAVSESRAQDIKNQIVRENNMGTWPTPDNSILIETLGPDVRTSAQNVYGQNLQTEATGTVDLNNLRYVFTYQGGTDFLKTLGSTGGQ